MIQDASSPKIGRSLLALIPMIILIAFAAMQAVSATDMQMNIATAIAVIYALGDKTVCELGVKAPPLSVSGLLYVCFYRRACNSTILLQNCYLSFNRQFHPLR